MKFKKFIKAVSIAAAIAFPIVGLACIGVYDSGYFSSPFSLSGTPASTEDEITPGYNETLDFWTGYTGGNVDREDIRKFFDEANSDSLQYGRPYRFYTYLERQGDNQAMSYIRDCMELNELVEEYNNMLWDYDTVSPTDIRQLISRIDKVSTSTPFKPRYEFLKIRAYGAIKDNDGVMKVWKKNEKSKDLSPALRNRMAGYVGGVLYRQEKYPEALDYFIQSGDDNSIRWCVEKLAGADNLAKLYNHDPNSAAISYVLEDFINYLIAESHAEEYENYFTVYDPEIRETLGLKDYDVEAQTGEMMALCRRVLEEGKSNNPMMWATTLGTLQTLEGNIEEGLNTLKDAKNLNGTGSMRDNLDNFTLWALMLDSGKGNNESDREFANAFDAYYKKVEKESLAASRDFSKKTRDARSTYDFPAYPSYNFLTNFMKEEAVKHYNKVGQPQRAMAYLAMIDNLPAVNGTEYYGEIRDMINETGPVADGIAFIKYAESPTPADDIDRLMQPYAKKYLNLANDAVGTRLMREGKFKEALPYLSKVDPKWARTQPIAPYLDDCIIFPEYYDFAKTSHHTNWDPYHSTINYKATFCAEMIDAMEEYDKLSGDDKALKALEIAGMCHFASPQGKGWGISDYAWSTTKPENEFTDMMRKWIDRAVSHATAVNTKMLAYYGLLSLSSGKGEYDYLYPITTKYDYNTGKTYYCLDSPTPAQLKALDYIASHWYMDNLPSHISHCDVLSAYVGGKFMSK